MRKVLSCLATACLFYSCSTPNEKSVTVTNVEITGFIKDYVKVVDNTYTFTNDGDEALISIKFELINKPSVDYCNDGVHSSIRLNAISDNDVILDTGVYGFSASQNEFKKIEELLNGKVGNTKVISFRWNYFGQDAKGIGKDIFTKAVTFELIDEGFKTDCNESKIAVSQGQITTNTGKNWDKVLDDYDNYVNSYVKFVKSMSTEDMTENMTEYADILQKAETLNKTLTDAKGSMTATQLKRYVQIQTKFVSAMD